MFGRFDWKEIQLGFALMWTFHFGKGGELVFLTGGVNEGIHEFNQQTKLDRWLLTPAQKEIYRDVILHFAKSFFFFFFFF